MFLTHKTAKVLRARLIIRENFVETFVTQMFLRDFAENVSKIGRDS